MKLRTEINLGRQTLSLDHQTAVLLMGSCFSENIGGKLSEHKFNALINPLGIAYNPVSLHQLLEIDSKTPIGELQQTTELYFHYHFHSTFNALSKESYADKLKQSIAEKEEFLKQNPTLILSYGTAWVHELKSNGQIVNNCHKQPASNFSRRLLKVEEIVQSWEKMNVALKAKFNCDFNFIFTVSPVRHIKDGFIENQQSKSTLNLAIHQICAEYDTCSYFPSYEIMMDDLRDYRFYKNDLLHPNDMAIDYIWEQFSKAYFSEESRDFNGQIKQFNQSINHRPFNPKSEKHQDFIKKLIEQIEEFEKESKIDYSKEIEQLNDQLLPF